MAKKFSLRVSDATIESFFDRQKLISWWDQETISKSKIMIVGAGALGNETIKNLLLLGFKNLLICDFDTIETSNLSRTILFGPSDIGKSKAHTAAARARQLCLSDDSRIASFHGDITSELGFGVFQEFDIVLGCVDNIEARRFVNRACRLIGRPWIDSGINELAGHVSLYVPDSQVCYECVLTDHQLKLARQRYSCDDVKRAYVQQARTPTVQVTSSIISGIQVQECVKHLCGRTAIASQRIWYDGARNQFEIFTLRPREDCEVHATFGKIIDVNLGNAVSIRDALHHLASSGFGRNPVIDSLGIRQFVIDAACRRCGKRISLYRPLSALSEQDLFCDDAHPENAPESEGAELPIFKRTIDRFDDATTEPQILNMTLAEVGIPPADIFAVHVADNDYRYVRLAADVERALSGNANR